MCQRLNPMQFSLKTLLLLPTFVGLVLGTYLLIERNRATCWDDSSQFWGVSSQFWEGFILDNLFVVTATACVVACYASLRSEDRSAFTHGPRRLLLRTTVFLVPFLAGLNTVIGGAGGPTTWKHFRVFDVYAGFFGYDPSPIVVFAFVWHTGMTLILGFAALWICGRLGHVARG